MASKASPPAPGAAPAGAQANGSRGPRSKPQGDSEPPKEIRTSEQSENFMMNVYKLKLCPRK